jgi:predicted dehydrogenase
VGLIGVGGFGASHLKALGQLEAEGLGRLVCVADPADKPLANTRRTLESRGVRWYLDYTSLLERETELDALAIAAPIHLHMEIDAAAIARNLFVYLEKPPVPLIQQLDDLLALDLHKKVAVGFQLVTSQPVQQLKLWITQGALGEIRNLRVGGCSPRSAEYYARTPWAGKMVYGGKPVFDGPATNALSHWLHNIMYLAGGKMDEFGLPVDVEAELYRIRPIESYDLICMRGHMESGASFQYVVTHATEKAVPCKLEVVGTKGRAWIAENSNVPGNNLELSESAPSCADPFLESWRQFVRSASGEEPRVATRLEDTRGYVLATNAALASSGGIHDIGRPSGNGGLDADKLELVELVEHSAQNGKLFSQMNADWSRSGGVIEIATWIPSEWGTSLP